MEINKTEVLERFGLKEITHNVSSRGHFSAKSLVKAKNINEELYQSYFNYDESIEDYYNRHNKLGGFSGIVAADNLIFDIDVEADLSKSQLITQGLIKRIEDSYGNKIYSIFFSGNKGFHVELPSFLFGEFAPDKNLSVIHKKMAIAILKPLKPLLQEAENLTEKKRKAFDTTIYKRTGLIRVVGSYNSKSGLYKIPITREELFNLTIDEIKELAKSPRQFITNFIPQENIGLVDLYQTMRIRSAKISNKDIESGEKANDEQIDGIIEIEQFTNIERNCGEIRQMLYAKDLSHEKRYQLATVLLHFGEEGREKIHEILKNMDDYDESYTDYQLDSIEEGGYKVPLCDHESLCKDKPCAAIKALNRQSCLALAFIKKFEKFNETIIVEEFQNRYPNLLFSLADHDYYDYENGVYLKLRDEVVKAKIGALMELYLPKMEVTAKRINNVFDRLKCVDKVIFKEEFNQDYGKVNLLNGVYDLRKKTKINHSPLLRHTIQLSFDYDENAKAPKFEKYLDEITDGDREKKDYLLKTMCYCLLPDYSYQKVFVFYGKGRNGKSVLTNIITALLGENNVSSMSIHSLANDRFALVNLYNKLLNVSSEIAQDDLSLETIKKLSGYDTIVAEVKYKGFVNYKNVAKLIINANQLPRFSELNTAVKERFVLVNFPRSFTEEEANPNLESELKKELSGIFNLVVSKFDEIVGRGGGIYYPVPESIKKEQRILQIESSTVMEFLEEECLYVESGSEMLSSLHDAYSKFCKTSGYRPLGIKNFRRALDADEKLKLERKALGWSVSGITLGKEKAIFMHEKAFAA